MKPFNFLNFRKQISFLSLSFFVGPAFAGAMSVNEVMEKSFNATKVKDSKGSYTFTLITSSGEKRVRETTGYTKLIPGTSDNRRLVTFLSPSDVKGTKTILVEHSDKDDDMWIYLPALKKVRRLVSSNKKDSFVGTDFSYGDVIGYRPSQWVSKFDKDEKVDGAECFKIISTPKDSDVADNTGYSKRIDWVDKSSFVTVKMETFDLSGKIYKKFKAKDIKLVDEKDKKWQAMYLEAENVQDEHRTVIELKNYKANVGVSDDMFTARSLEN